MNTPSIELSISGMSCDGCVRRVTALLKKQPGITVRDVQIGSARVELAGSPDEQARERDVVLEALAKAGYPATAHAAP